MSELIIKMLGNTEDLMNARSDIIKHSSYIKAVSGGRLEIEVGEITPTEK